MNVWSGSSFVDWVSIFVEPVFEKKCVVSSVHPKWQKLPEYNLLLGPNEGTLSLKLIVKIFNQAIVEASPKWQLPWKELLEKVFRIGIKYV